MRRIRSRLTYANVISTIALFLVLAGGSAVALSGHNTVQSDDLGPGAQVKAPDVADNAVDSANIKDGQLNRADLNGAEQTLWAAVLDDGTIVHQSGGITAKTWGSAGGYVVDFNRDVSHRALMATGTDGSEIVDVVLCNGGAGMGYDCSPNAPNDSQHVEVDTFYSGAGYSNARFFIAALPK
jgi:hypothetical protein